MLSILGRGTRMCDGTTRRELLRAGGCTLLGGLTLPWLLQAEDELPTFGLGPAKSVIFVNLLGGPSHIDTFDMKPDSPAEIRGEFRPIATTVPGLQICELLPRTAQRLHHATLIRSHSHLHNSHNPYNVLTGDGSPSDNQNFPKQTHHPSIGSVMQHAGLTSHGVPSYVYMPSHPGHSRSLKRPGPYGGYLGRQYDPLFTTCDPKFEDQLEDPQASVPGFYYPIRPIGDPTLPSWDGLPNITASRLDRRHTLLEQVDRRLSELDTSPATERMSYYKQRAFNLLTSNKMRQAFDLSRESPRLREKYGHNLFGSCALTARRLIEAGARFVGISTESKYPDGGAAVGGGHWDSHQNNFGMLKSFLLPMLDRMYSALIDDLHVRGLLESTLVVVMGEMGRTPKINKHAGRDHWPQCGFILLTGGGVKEGMVYGSSDKHGAYPVDHPVSSGDHVATIYQLLGIDPRMTIDDLGGRPIPISHGGEPVSEIIA